MLNNLSMKTVIGATEVRNRFGQILKEVHRGEKHYVVEKGGIPVAALISMQEYEEFRQWLAQKLHHQLGRALGVEFRRQGISEEKLIEDMEQDRKAIYEQTYGAKS
jgi:prevent-host-death family protein